MKVNVDVGERVLWFLTFWMTIVIVELAARTEDISVIIRMDELFGVVHVRLVVDEVHEGFNSRRMISEGRLITIVVARG